MPFWNCWAPKNWPCLSLAVRRYHPPVHFSLLLYSCTKSYLYLHSLFSLFLPYICIKLRNRISSRYQVPWFRRAQPVPSTYLTIHSTYYRHDSNLYSSPCRTHTFKIAVQLEILSYQFMRTCPVGELRLDSEHSFRSTFLVLQKVVLNASIRADIIFRNISGVVMRWYRLAVR